MGDRPVARTVPIHRTTQTQNKRTQDINASTRIRNHYPSVSAGAKSVRDLVRAAAVIGSTIIELRTRWSWVVSSRHGGKNTEWKTLADQTVRTGVMGPTYETVFPYWIPPGCSAWRSNLTELHHKRLFILLNNVTTIDPCVELKHKRQSCSSVHISQDCRITDAICRSRSTRPPFLTVQLLSSVNNHHNIVS
jgi:hypothetical protein